MSLETFEAGYAGTPPPRRGVEWPGVWRLQQQVDRIIDTAWPQPWGLAGARSDFPMFSTVAQDALAQDIFFKPDGTKFYIVGNTNDTVYQYSCFIPWDINTATYDNISFFVGGQDSSPFGLFFKPDGLVFYVAGAANERVYQYACSTAWDIGTASYTGKSFSVNAQDTDQRAIFFKDDGTKFYIVGTSADTVFQYSCSTAWDVSTASYDSKSFSVTAQEITPTGLFFKDNGTKFYIVGSTGNKVVEYTCSTAWDISTGGQDAFYVGGQDGNPQDLFFKPDGTKFYIVGSTNDTVYQYSCSTAWDVSTASYDSKSFSVGTQESNPTGLFFKDDGTKFYIAGSTSDNVFQYSCSTAWDISTASYDSKSFSVATQDGTPQGLFFKPDGTKFYIVGSASDTVYQYSCSTAWDISTASYDNKSFSVAAQETGPGGLFFKDDGTKFYIVGTTSDSVYQYSLLLE